MSYHQTIIEKRKLDVNSFSHKIDTFDTVTRIGLPTIPEWFKKGATVSIRALNFPSGNPGK